MIKFINQIILRFNYISQGRVIMKKIPYTLFAIFLVFSLFGCGPTEQELQEYSEQTQTAMAPTITPTPEPTETPSIILGIDEPITLEDISYQVIGAYTHDSIKDYDKYPSSGNIFLTIRYIASDYPEEFWEDLHKNATLICNGYEAWSFFTLKQTNIDSVEREEYVDISYEVPEGSIFESCIFSYKGHDFKLATFFD